MLPLPIEVVESIIDHLSFSFYTLKACALVCKSWYPRSRLHLLRRIVLFSRTQVKHFAHVMQRSLHVGPDSLAITNVSNMVSEVVLRGDDSTLDIPPTTARASPPNRAPSIAHLSTFAVMLARKLPRLTYLGITSATFTRSSLHPDVHLHLSAFVSITWLDLHNVAFASPADFARLVCAFPGVRRLGCWAARPMFAIPTNVTPSNDGKDTGSDAVDAYWEKHFHPGWFARKAPGLQLADLTLNGVHNARTVVSVLVRAGLATRLTYMTIGYYAPVPEQDIQPLLEGAGRTLATLDVTLVPERQAEPKLLNDSAVPVYRTALNLSSNTNLAVLFLRYPLSLASDTTTALEWLPHLLASAAPALRQVMLVLDIRHQVDAAPLDRICAAFTPAVCAAIEEAICAIAEPPDLDAPQSVAGTGSDLRAPPSEQQQRRPKFKFEQLIGIQFALWVSAAPGLAAPDAEEWRARLLPRFPLLCAHNVFYTKTAVEDWVGFQH
ncbi:uncharacterized protein FIBRA_00449 [Fibroporia radiculosa]|uniref:Uncharacterized protein n=1 Tax=Fibroporia radiculosa TaxID=599839 RepID=J4I7Y1_9APHY|nr:uncharacterized protein FIBRA_00449 [Fibroporia radiculosa]CCL98451.1 predicted protein [Fibroporia radiculosa]